MNTLTLLMTTLLLTSYAKVSSQHISDCILPALMKYFEIQVPKPYSLRSYLNGVEQRAAGEDWDNLAFCHDSCCRRL